MTLDCISSGSNANCYFLTNSRGEILFLDAGVTLDKIMRYKNFTLFSKVVGALITHQHKDHSLSVKELETAGVSVYGYMNLSPNKRYRIGSYEVIPFYVEHDVMNYGFIINEVGNVDRFVYATDCSTLPLIGGINHWLIECNYCVENWNMKLESENANLKYLGRVAESHMNLDTLQHYFSKINRHAKTIILCHLSENGNANKEMMLERLSGYGDIIDVATKNKQWRLTKNVSNIKQENTVLVQGKTGK